MGDNRLAKTRMIVTLNVCVCVCVHDSLDVTISPHTGADIWWLATEVRVVGEWAVCILQACFLESPIILVCYSVHLLG